MASLKPTSLVQQLLMASLTVALLLISPSHAQIPSTPSCSATAIAGLSPCMSFLTNNGSSPTADCCDSLKNLTGTSMDCMCLLVTGTLPFQIPINRTLAISLPRACNLPGVPLQCKAAAGAPVPAPAGSAALGPSLAPGVSTSDTPTSSVVPETPSEASPPESGTTTPDLTPPTSTTGSRPTINTSAAAAAAPSYSFSPSLVVLALGFVFYKFY